MKVIDKADSSLEKIISENKLMFPEIKVIAISMQASLEMFNLQLEMICQDGEVDKSKVAAVKEIAIKLKADAGTTMIEAASIDAQL